MSATETPMMRQYLRIKEGYTDAILFFRLGDFYEMFNDDALSASKILGLTLTHRGATPMCGIPYHSSRRYIARLLKAGHKVAICEQTGTISEKLGIVEREVIEVVTPGVAIEDEYLESEANNYLLALVQSRGRLCEAYLDLSTGDLRVANFPAVDALSVIRKELARLEPREIIVQESLLEDNPSLLRVLQESNRASVNRMPDWAFDLEESRRRLCSLLKVINLKAFAIGDEQIDILPVGALLDYVEQMVNTALPHIGTVHVHRPDQFVALDEAAQRNLELIRNLQDSGSRYTLLETLDHTLTAMGGRRLRRWLLSPLKHPDRIAERQEKVAAFYHDQRLLHEIRTNLDPILDLERLAARVAMDRAHAKDLVAIGTSLRHGLIVDRLADGMLSGTDRMMLTEDVELLGRALVEEPSIKIGEGRTIRAGYDEALDKALHLRDSSSAVLEEYLDEERRKTKLSMLKIRYNRIIGYYFEVGKAHGGKLPDYFVRRQSTTNVERFTTERLAELESRINGVSEQIETLEHRLFLQVRTGIGEHLDAIARLCALLSRIDSLQSLARAALLGGYIRPIVDEENRIDIQLGRHPVVEAHLPSGDFTPNSLLLDDRRRFALITGAEHGR